MSASTGTESWRVAAGGAVRSSLGRYAGALAVFVGLTVALFWPLASDLNGSALGGFTDATMVMRDYWAIDAESSTPFTSTHDSLSGAPEGRPRSPAAQIAAPLQPGVIWLLQDVVGVVAAVNLFMLLGIVATGFAAFVLVDRAGFGFLPGLFAGCVAAFNPWMVERAFSGHVAYAHGWVFVVLFAALAKLLRERTIRAAALAGGAWALCFFTASYFGLLGFALVAGFAVVDIARRRRFTEALWTFTLLSVLGIVGLLVLVPGLVSVAVDTGAVAALSRSVDWLKTGGASWQAYVLPSPRHPLLGDFAESARPSDPFNEKVLYVGYTTIALAGATVVSLVRSRRTPAARPSALVLLAAAVAPIAYFASLPRDTTFMGSQLPTPAYLIGQLTTAYRVYARFGYLVALALAILAAPALARLGRRRGGTAVALGLLCVLAFEFLPGRLAVAKIGTPPAHVAWLAGQPRGIVAHYPLAADKLPAQQLSAREAYYQRFSHQPLFAASGASAGTREEAIRVLARHLKDLESPRVLAAEHVRYVVVHDDVYRDQEERPPRLGRRFELLERFGDVRVYELHARPLDIEPLLEQRADEIARLWSVGSVTLSIPGAGFHNEEVFDPSTGPWRWLVQGGNLSLNNPNAEDVRMRLSFKAFSNQRARELALRDAEGRELARVTVPPQLQEFVLGPFRVPPGASVLHLTATPAPESLGRGDDRAGSVFLSPLTSETLADFPPEISPGD